MKTISYLRIITVVALCVYTLDASAYDFMVDGLCYNKNNDGKSVTVTYQNSSSPSYSDLSGAITIPDTVTFNEKTYSVTSIDWYAFSSCSSLTSVTISNSVTEIGDAAFINCTALTSVTIGNSVTSIGWYAFGRCKNLTSITIPNSVTSIEHKAFEECEGLTSVTIPNSVTSIDSGVFAGCTALTSITVESGNEVYDSRNNCNAIIETASNTLISGCKNTTIPNSVTSIGDDAFFECEGLTSVILPNSVTTIGSGAFRSCYNMTSINIPNSVTSIGSGAFSGCSALISINIPNSVISIGASTFKKCDHLRNVIIGNSVTTIGESAFEDCSQLTNLIIGNAVTAIAEDAFLGCSALTEVTIPSSVNELGNSAFRFCRSLKSLKWTAKNCNTFERKDPFDECPISKVVVGNEVESIPDHFMYMMMSLDSLTIGNSVKTIGKEAFYACDGPVGSNVIVIIPNSVTYIGYKAFAHCNRLKSISIGKSVDTICENAFWSCNKLESIVVHPENTKYDSRNNCNAIIETATNTLITGGKITVIPKSVTAIGDCAFTNNELRSVTIPESITSIGYMTFYGCKKLEKIDSYPDPRNVKLDRLVFEYVPKDGTLHVLPQYLEAYQSLAQWMDFYNIDSIETQIIGDIDGNGIIDVEDVNAAINIILKLNSINDYSGSCDMDGNGIVDVEDVNAMINIILKLD